MIKLKKNVNRGLIAGIILRKSETHHKASQSMFNYAFEQRSKAQDIQRQMNTIKQAGHINKKDIRSDRHRFTVETNKHHLSTADKEIQEIHRQRLKRSYKQRGYFRQKKRKQIPDLNFPPANHD